MLNAEAKQPTQDDATELSPSWSQYETMALPELKLWTARLPLVDLEVEQVAGRFYARVRPKDSVLGLLMSGEPVATLEEAQQLALRLAGDVLLEELRNLGRAGGVSEEMQDMRALGEILLRIDRRAVRLHADRITQKLTHRALKGMHLSAAIRVQRGQLHLRVDRVGGGDPPGFVAAEAGGSLSQEAAA